MTRTRLFSGLLITALLATASVSKVEAKSHHHVAQPASQSSASASTPSIPASLDTSLVGLDKVHIVGADADSTNVKELYGIFTDLTSASNRHSIEDILKHYNPQFISGDNLTLPQVKDLILETWQSYPDLKYDSKPVEIRISGDWATIETADHSEATAAPDKDILNVPGHMTSDSRSLLFLRKLGNTWEITSDATIWEQAIIRFGVGSDINIVLSAPEQVKAGTTYSATIQAAIPDGMFSIATIDNQPLTYPHTKVDDKFRTLTGDSNSLQRVLTANSTNHNEIVTATLGLTTVEQKDADRPALALNGIATIIKRVNVVPISSEDVLKAAIKHEEVSTSASGKIHVQTVNAESDSQADADDNDTTAPSDSAPTDNNGTPQAPSSQPAPAHDENGD